MTQHEWQHLESLIGAMTPDDKQRLVTILTSETPAPEHQVPPTTEANGAFVWDPSNPSLGAFADEPELIDAVMRHVYHSRENDPLRAGE